MPTLIFDFAGGGEHRLSGRLEQPDGAVRGWAIFAHCFTCGKDQRVAIRIARALAAQGIGTLRFDFAGIGGSEGSLAEGSFAADRRDLIAAAEAMAAAGQAPSLLVGHSFGGAAALAAAGDMPSIKAVATIAAPFDVAHVLRHFDPAAVETIQREGEAEVVLAGRGFRIGRPFLDDLRQHDQGARIEALHRPLMILHAPFDEVVDIENATRIFLAARHPKSFVSLDKADHLLTGAGQAEQVAALVAAWAAPYLPHPEPTRDEGEADVVAEETGAGRFQVAIQAGGIRFLADEPAAVGGLGSGPTPYDLLSAGLAACTTMTLRMYADQKGWEIGRVRTAVGHAKRKGEAPADLFSRRIDLDADLDPERRARLLEIADRCPVHRTLEASARVETSLGGPPAAAEPIEAHMTAVEGLVESAG
nr:bifunctional alpha/beta hydrolase/OsmC family protein [Sphingomonas sp. Y57]